MFINYFLEASETIKKIKISVDHLQLLHANIVSFHLKKFITFWLNSLRSKKAENSKLTTPKNTYLEKAVHPKLTLNHTKVTIN